MLCVLKVNVKAKCNAFLFLDQYIYIVLSLIFMYRRCQNRQCARLGVKLVPLLGMFSKLHKYACICIIDVYFDFCLSKNKILTLNWFHARLHLEIFIGFMCWHFFFISSFHFRLHPITTIQCNAMNRSVSIVSLDTCDLQLGRPAKKKEKHTIPCTSLVQQYAMEKILHQI